jgi:carbon storage regulator
MLVIRRKQGESVRIGEEIEVQILELSATRVVLGIRAPSTIRVTRTELLEAAAEANRAAAASAKEFAPDKISSYLTNIRR